MAASMHDFEPPAHFDEAHQACGYGKFNLLLLLAAVPSIMTTIFETTTMSYIIPIAECDLKLDLMDKGLLNAATYAGTMISAVPWAFIGDTYGRKRVLVVGLLLDFVVVLVSSISQSSHALMAFKLLGGSIVCGPYAVIMSYVAEFHDNAHRSPAMLAVGMSNSVGMFLMPILAIAILPNDWDVNIYNWKFRSWNFFLAIACLPSLIGGLSLIFFPESPKYLMSQGRNESALRVFHRIYKVNTGKDKDTFPIKKLHDEAPLKTAKNIARKSAENALDMKTRRKHAKDDFVEGLKQLKPMFSKPYICTAIMVYLVGFCIILSQNTIRLWLPQIFATLSAIKEKNPNEEPSMCGVLNHTSVSASNTKDSENCEVHLSSTIYINNVIVGVSGICGYLVAAFFVILVGNNRILSFCQLMCSLTGISFYFAKSELMILILAAIFITGGSVSASTVINVAATIFPTSMRTMVIVLIMTAGRLGCVIGNTVFPFLIKMGCIPPFIMIASLGFLSFIISLFLPDSRTSKMI